MVFHGEDGVYWLESHKQNIWVDGIALYLDLGGGPMSVHIYVTCHKAVPIRLV